MGQSKTRMNWQGEGACEEEKVKYKDRPSLECNYLPAAGVREGKLSKREGKMKFEWVPWLFSLTLAATEASSKSKLTPTGNI